MEIDTIFEANNLSFSFLGKNPAVCDVSFKIQRGESVVILGANGSGKSSIMNLLNGLIFPDNGEIIFMGRKITKHYLKDEKFNAYFRQKVGFVFQNSDVQLFSSTVWDEIAFGPLHLDLDHEDVKARVEDVSALLGVKKLWDRPPYQLSGGEKKRVAIASTIAINPDVLLLDEPINGLDPRSQAELMGFLQEMKKIGKTIIISTHDLKTAELVSDRAIVLNEAHNIEGEGPTPEVLKNKALLLKVNLIHEHIHCHDGEIHGHAHGHSGDHAHDHNRNRGHNHDH